MTKTSWISQDLQTGDFVAIKVGKAVPAPVQIRTYMESMSVACTQLLRCAVQGDDFCEQAVEEAEAGLLARADHKP